MKMKPPSGPKKQTQTKPISPTPKAVKQNTDACSKRSDIWFIRLMRRWTKKIRALELFGEKNRLPRGSNLGQAGGNLCLWGPERFFSIVRNAQYIYQLFGKATKTANFFPKKLRKWGKGRGISLIWTSSSTFQESYLKFAENSGKSVKFGKSVTFGITGGTCI